MLRNVIDSRALQTARAAFDGLARRQEAISGNIANIDTPGYERRAVDFEGQLRREVGYDQSATTNLATTDPRHIGGGQSGGSGAPGKVAPRDVVAERNDSNAVDIDEEMTLLAETQIRYQALSQMVGRRLSTLRGVIRG